MIHIEQITDFLSTIYEFINSSFSFDDIQSNNENILTKTFNQFRNLTDQIPEELENLKNNIIINPNNMQLVDKYKQFLFSTSIKTILEHLKSFYIDFKNIYPQINKRQLDLILGIKDNFNLDDLTHSLLLIFTSKLCRTSLPSISFDLIMEAFKIKNDLAKFLGLDHLKNYIFKEEVLSEQLLVDNCPICGEKGAPFHNAPCYNMINYTDNFLPSKLWMKCNSCENLYSKYYPHKFFNTNHSIKVIRNGVTPTPSHLQSNVSTHTLRNWCDILNNISEYSNGTDILEIGIGKGALIATALEFGYSIDCIEIDENIAYEISNILNHDIICCDFLNFRTDKTYDIITMGDVIEHLSNPINGLKKAYSLLNDDGVLWISTPNYNSAFNKLHKINTAMWNEPYHLTYFSKTGLENIIKKLGFEILDYRISINYNGSMEIILKKVRI